MRLVPALRHRAEVSQSVPVHRRDAESRLSGLERPLFDLRKAQGPPPLAPPPGDSPGVSPWMTYTSSRSSSGDGASLQRRAGRFGGVTDLQRAKSQGESSRRLRRTAEQLNRGGGGGGGDKNK